MKIAISIGQDADDEVLIEFTGNKELVLQANNGAPLVLDMSNIPNPDDFDEGAVW